MRRLVLAAFALAALISTAPAADPKLHPVPADYKAVVDKAYAAMLDAPSTSGPA